LGDLNDWKQFGFFVLPGKYGAKHEELLKESIARHKFGLGFTIVGAELNDGYIAEARSAIAWELDCWLGSWKRSDRAAPSDFSLQWNEKQQRWELQIDYHGLLIAAISLQLALVVADADSLYCCSGCAIPYIRSRAKRRPKRGCANFCEKCNAGGTAQRMAVRRYRNRMSKSGHIT